MAIAGEPERAVLPHTEREGAHEAARVLTEYLNAHPAQPANLTVGDAATRRTLVVPPDAFQLIVRLMQELARGRAVTIVPHNREMTTQEAAEFLSVSRPYVVGLLEKGQIPYRKVGPRRRIRFEDVLGFKERDDAERVAGAGELTRESEGLGLYRDEP